ncbi:CHAT domain-containing protein [Geodermatophilus sp. CPCC 205761]|uniref:CHAT domain-containing protein n=1 Tax=Geodermatophilus sp. CPCC 205761 TaxID=2936597 RepID=UPI003EF00B7E
MEQLKQLTLSQGWDDVLRILQANPTLLSKRSIELLDYVIGQLAEQGQFKTADRFQGFHRLLVRARHVGIEKAVAHEQGALAEIPQELTAILRSLSSPKDSGAVSGPERMQLLQRAMDLTQPEKNPLIWAGLHGMLGDALLTEPTGDRADNVERAISAYEVAAEFLPLEEQPTTWTMNELNLSNAYLERIHGDAETNLRQARQAFTEALHVLTGGQGPSVLAPDSGEELIRYAEGSTANLRQALDLSRQAVLYLDGVVGEAEGAVNMARLARLLGNQATRLEVNQEGAPEGEADVGGPGASGGSADEPLTRNRAWELTRDGAMKLTEYWATERIETLFEALETLEQAARSTPSTSRRRAGVMDLLGKALRAYHEASGAPEVLERAILAHTEAVRSSPADEPDRAHFMIDLAEDLDARYRYTQDDQDLDEALGLAEDAVALTPPTSEERPQFLRLLGAYRRARYSRYGDVADLEAAIEALHDALQLASPGSDERIGVLTGLASALFVRYGRSGDVHDLDEAVDLSQQAAALMPASTDARAVVVYGLGRNLAERYLHRGDAEDLAQAIESYRSALSLMTPASPDRLEVLGSLGTALNYRYDLLGDRGDLAEGLELWEQAVELSPAGSHDRAAALAQLSVGLRDRYYREGAVADLERAINLSRDAVASEPDGSTSRPGYLAGLGTGLREHYRITDDISELDAAIECWQEALAASPESDPARPDILSSLGIGLHDRYVHTGEVSDLDESIEGSRQAVALAPATAPRKAGFMNNLAGALMERFHLGGGDPADLDAAIDLLRRAVAAGDAETLSDPLPSANLALALSMRYDALGDAADLDQAKSLFRRVVPACETSRIATALSSSRAWGDWSVRRHSWQEAAEAYGYGLRAMDLLFSGQLTRVHKEVWLSQANGLPAQAAYALAKHGDLEGAAVSLERGRALLLSDALERDRVDLEQLSALGHDDLAQRYRNATKRLAALERGTLVSPTGLVTSERPAGALGHADALEEMPRARRDLDAAVSSIRKVPGYEDFLRPADLDDVTSAAPVLAYVAAAEPGGLGLVVADGSLSPLWLPQLTSGVVLTQVRRYVSAYVRRRERPDDWIAVLGSTTRWLWDVLMGPLVEMLAAAGRAVLVPGGLLGLLPLHAAWTDDAHAPTGRRYALDDLVLTYAPNARALTAARARAGTVPADGVLAVDDPRPVAAGPLPSAGPEVDAAIQHFSRSRRVSGPEATLSSVVPLLADYPVLHFACHALADLLNPLESGIVLASNERLTARALLADESLHARLAVLSACETAVPGTQIPDEVVNLPTSLFQAGVAGVVGSLWSVSDASTMALMVRFYELWRADGLDPAEALRRAQQWVRDSTNAEKRDRFPRSPELAGTDVPAETRRLWERAHAHRSPYFWAPFIYLGV